MATPPHFPMSTGPTGEPGAETRDSRAPKLTIGVDTGGTFTDVVFVRGRERGTFKLLSTPDDPARAVLTALARLFGERSPDRLTYGTTVATNAMLERGGARTALVTTGGFEDVLEIGRQARPELYALEPRTPPPLVERAMRIGIEERVLFDGEVERRPSPDSLRELASRLARRGVESVAVCLLHAHVNPENEVRVSKALAALGIPVTLSHQLSPQPGEYERTSTTVANAYVRPAVSGHLESLAERSHSRRFLVMQSNGGAIGVDTARAEPVRTMLSGPAGGVAAAWNVARGIGLDRIVTFDMGGTSTDVALVDGEIPRRSDTLIAGLPVRSPCIDIHTVGAGGGSLARLDAGGSLKVGPESAGADPGPACYGHGERPTVTDANVVLGRLRPEAFLGGGMQLDVARAHEALAGLADAMQTGVETAAEGIVKVVEGAMERAIRVITVERGQDPRTCALVAFGGAAGLHACGLADGLGIPDVLIPADPGLLSAWGVLEGPIVRDREVATSRVDPAASELGELADPLEREARAGVAAEGIASRSIRVRRWVRLRYVGQSLELEIPLGRSYRAGFDREHHRLFHTSSPSRPVEVCGLRVTAEGRVAGARRTSIGTRPRRRPRRAASTGRAYVGGRGSDVSLFDRRWLEPGDSFEGPAIVTEYSSTVLVAAGWRAQMDDARNLRLDRGRAGRSAGRITR
ncbi:MAG: hydantoinase/oxoprolinase family protein [Candidatus Binatia bacterium]